MTRKDFVALAAIVASIEDLKERSKVAELMVAFCRQRNANFDKQRFLSACGL